QIFESFRETFLKKYGSKIFRLEADEPLGDIFTNAKYVAKMWAGVSYEEVKRIAQAQGIEMSRATDDLVSRYFVHEEDNAVYKDSRVAEREVNALLGGFKDVVSRSEASNFKTSDYREYNFTREKYEKIRNLCCGKMAVERIEILDMFYGVGCEKLSIRQIAEKKGLEYEVAKRKLDDARVAALSVYLGKSNTKQIDAEYYIPYIENMDLDIHPTYRAMMREYIIEGKSYEEIAKAHGVTKHKVSMNILDGMFKIDLYRFGLLQKNKYSKEEITSVLYSGLFNGEEINIVLEALGKTPVKEICAKYKTTSTKVESLMTKLSQNCFRKKVEGVDVSIEDIAREISIHPCEMVLSFQERLMLSSLYGIKCDVNPKGKQYTKEELRAAHPELKNKFNQILGNALGTVAGKKLGIVRATYSYMEREKLKKSLADPFIPISQEERELLYYAFELYGYPYKSVSTLAKERGENLSNMRRRIQRIFVTIFKYENCEIEPAISPESDILPYLKFFSKIDQKILTEKHVDGMSNSEIAKTHGMSDNQVYNLLLRIEVHLKDLIEGTLVGFDFDYFYDCVDRDDIPFYGNKALAKKVFILYYEAHMSANEIIASLGLDCSQDVVMDVLSSLKTSVLKYKEGMRKSKMYSLDEVTSYYASHKDEMDKDQLLVYKRYFLRQKRENSSLKAISQNGVNATIAYDLMKDNGELVFDIKTATKADILEILRKHKNELSDRTVATLQKLYNIDSSEFMKGSDQMKVLRFLSNLDDNGKLLSIKQVA
ncbi:MAG TPA: hypothetical protein DCY94_05010, partial [Firmicutes bacterium]|nr:hypothetical protein [Bacillota bacterium]